MKIIVDYDMIVAGHTEEEFHYIIIYCTCVIHFFPR